MFQIGMKYLLEEITYYKAFNMKYILNYCSGGLGNRLKPMSSCFDIAQKTNRSLGAMWYPTMRCGSYYKDLFENAIVEPNIDEIMNSNSVSIYSYMEWVNHDFNLNGNKDLMNLSNRYGVIPLDNIKNVLNDDKKYIIVYSNNFLNGFSQESENCKMFFKTLSPIEKIKHRVDEQVQKLNLNKSVIGVHARGTDFEPGGISVNTYIDKMNKIYNYNKSVKFFVCSDSKHYEDVILTTFPRNVMLNQKQHWVYKATNNNTWVNNVQTPKSSVQESLVDMYLLSKTDFKIYHPDSTFAHVINML